MYKAQGKTKDGKDVHYTVRILVLPAKSAKIEFPKFLIVTRAFDKNDDRLTVFPVNFHCRTFLRETMA
jgi:hypothetical protein